MSDSTGQTVSIPNGVDPLDALEAFENGDPGHVATNGDDPSAASQEGGPASPPNDGAAPAQNNPAAGQEPGQADDWFMPGKFRTAEDMRANYDQLERERGRLAQELGEARQAFQQAPQLPQQAPQPYMPGFNHPQQGYTQEQVEQLQYENPAQLADWFAVQRTAEAMAQLAPALAPLMESVNQQEARNAVDTLRRSFGDDVVQRHSQALAEMIQSDDSYFLDEHVRVNRMATALKALEFDHINKQAQAQPRAADGTFAAKSEPAQQVYVEPGSTGAQSVQTTEPQVDPVVAGMRGVGVVRDRFGTVPPELQHHRRG